MGKSFGRYEILARIASGGMAEIFLAVLRGPRGFERRVALKQILPDYAGDPEFVEMFLDEARIAASLSHPNICQLFDFGHENGRYYIAMEYIPGPTLAQLLTGPTSARGKPLPPLLGVYIIARAAEGLAYAHEKTGPDGKPLGIVHRDVSPQNLLVTYDGQVKIVDFGIARAADRHAQTRSGQLRGKIGYLSPEQIESKELDGRSDVFTLGILLHELLSGRPLFGGSTPMEAMQEVLRCVIPPLPDDPRIPGAVREVTMEALARDPEERLGSGRELARRLDEALLAVRPRPDAEALARHVQALFPQDLPPPAASVSAARGSPLPTEKNLPLILGHWPSPPSTNAPLPARVTRRMNAPATPARPPEGKPRWRLPLALAVFILLASGIGIVVSHAWGPAGPPPAPAAVGSASEGMVGAGPPMKAALEPTSRAATGTFGWLTLDTSPRTEVFLDDQKLGETPLIKVKLPAGRQHLRTVNRRENIERVIEVVILPERITTQKLAW